MSTLSPSFAPGAIVAARGREWIVQPESTAALLVLRPLYGVDAETVGVLPGLEPIESASFAPPVAEGLGDFATCRLLRDAARIATRSSAGPFRSFGSIGCEPRPYQLVPLLVALRRPVVRLLLADDVGIGKTVEASLIAAELLARGDARRFAVLCPPHLAEQWERELRRKFHLDPVLVLASTAARLERQLPAGQSIFEAYPQMVISIDFVKGDRYRNEFLRACPDLVVVDEAHSCTLDLDATRTRQARHGLVAELAKDASRHLVLVTATPHSGKQGAFRSLVSLLDPGLSDLPDDLTGPERENDRRRLSQYLVQRRRRDITRYADSTTPFPKRNDLDHATYRLTGDYRRLLDGALAYARERIAATSGDRRRQRVHLWAAIGLLRAISSSPAAAVAALTGRAAGSDAVSVEDVDDSGRASVYDRDLSEVETAEGSDDTVSGAEVADAPTGNEGEVTVSPADRSRLSALAAIAGGLHGDADPKLKVLVGVVKDLLERGRRPIVFCRYIATAEYVGRELAARLRVRGLEVAAVSGDLPPADREARIEVLKKHDRCILVATDCLSEGINLQDRFDAVVHYDLPWNPTRLEQREGRVDRFNQRSKDVDIAFVFGEDNHVDGRVFKVLVEKHRRIREMLGVSVAVPASAEKVVDAIFEWLVLEQRSGDAPLLPGMDDYLAGAQRDLDTEWDREADREKRSRTMFAHEGIQPEVAKAWLDAMREVGRGIDVAEFITRAVRLLGGTVADERDGRLRIAIAGTPLALRDMLPDGFSDEVVACFDGSPADGETLLVRTHPFVEALAAFVLQATLDPQGSLRAGRSGAFRTSAVKTLTTLLLVRQRFTLVRTESGRRRESVVEESRFLAFEGLADDPPAERRWLADAELDPLLAARPSGNSPNAQAVVRETLAALPNLTDELDRRVAARADELLATHRAVRDEAKLAGVRVEIQHHRPVDVIAVHVLQPA